MANKNEVQNVQDEKQKNSKFFYFDPREAREFSFGKSDDLLSVILYKKLFFGIVSDDNVSKEMLAHQAAFFLKQIRQLIGSMNLMDTNEEIIRKTEYESGRFNSIYIIYIPFTGIIAKTISNIHTMINSINDKYSKETGVRFSMNITNVAIFKADPRKKQVRNPFVRGFGILSHSKERRDDNNKVIEPADDYIKSAIFLDKEIGVDPKDIHKINRFCMNNTKINLFNDTENLIETPEYKIIFKSRLSFMMYQMFLDKESGKFKVQRHKAHLSLRFSKVYDSIVVPTGISFNVNTDIIDIDSFHDIFIGENGKNILTEGYNPDDIIDEKSYIFTVFNSDNEFFNKELFASFTPRIEVEESAISEETTVETEEVHNDTQMETTEETIEDYDDNSQYSDTTVTNEEMVAETTEVQSE